MSSAQAPWMRLLAPMIWNEAQAQEVLEAQRRSGLCIAAFARRHQLLPQRLYSWQKRLTDRPAQQAPPSAQAQPLFVPVRVVEPPVPPAAPPAPLCSQGSGCVELVLKTGHLIRLFADFEEETLHRVLRVLHKETSC